MIEFTPDLVLTMLEEIGAEQTELALRCQAQNGDPMTRQRLHQVLEVRRFKPKVRQPVFDGMMTLLKTLAVERLRQAKRARWWLKRMKELAAETE